MSGQAAITPANSSSHPAALTPLRSSHKPAANRIQDQMVIAAAPGGTRGRVQSIVVRDNTPINAAPARFMRLQVSGP